MEIFWNIILGKSEKFYLSFLEKFHNGDFTPFSLETYLSTYFPNLLLK